MQTNKYFSSNTRFQRNRVKSSENMGHSNSFSHNRDYKKKFNRQRKFNGNRNTYDRYSKTKDTKITTKVDMEKPKYVDNFPSLGKKVVKKSVVRKTDDILTNNTYSVLANLGEFHEKVEQVKPVKPVVKSIWGKHSLQHIKDCYKKKTEQDTMKLNQKKEKMKALHKKKMEDESLKSSSLLYSYSHKSPLSYNYNYDNDNDSNMEDDKYENYENVHSDESDYGDYYY